MKTITLNHSLHQEENMAIQIILLQVFLLIAIYFLFKSKTFQPDVQLPPVIDNGSLGSPATPYSSKNIVDIIWSCQPTVVINGKRGCLL